MKNRKKICATYKRGNHENSDHMKTMKCFPSIRKIKMLRMANIFCWYSGTKGHSDVMPLWVGVNKIVCGINKAKTNRIPNRNTPAPKAR